MSRKYDPMPFAVVPPYMRKDPVTQYEILENMRDYLCRVTGEMDEGLVEFKSDILDEFISIRAYVDAAVAQIIGSSVELQDDVVAALLGDDTTDTRVALAAILDGYARKRKVEHSQTLLTTDAFRGSGGAQPTQTDSGAWGGDPVAYETQRTTEGFVKSGSGSLVANPNSSVSNFMGVPVSNFAGTRAHVKRSGLPVSGSFYLYTNRPDLNATQGVRIRFHSGGATLQHVSGGGTVSSLGSFTPGRDVVLQTLGQLVTVWNDRDLLFEIDLAGTGRGVSQGYCGFGRDGVAPVGMSVDMFAVSVVF